MRFQAYIIQEQKMFNVIRMDWEDGKVSAITCDNGETYFPEMHPFGLYLIDDKQLTKIGDKIPRKLRKLLMKPEEPKIRRLKEGEEGEKNYTFLQTVKYHLIKFYYYRFGKVQVFWHKYLRR